MLFLFIAILLFITQYLFDAWWLILVCPFFMSVLLSRGYVHAFFSGFFAVGIVWFSMAFYLNYQNESLLLNRVGTMFSLPAGYWLFVITFLIGGIAGGISSQTGYSLKALWTRANK
ncbi:MAG: hypothetical protein EAZ55_04395 [Cytophagales bacterium]|nr:MAG: hypothetical protein EAZ55_04395 [Cytophagales bacterium]